MFTCSAGTCFTDDVILAAWWAGQLQPLWEDFLGILALEEKADQESLELDEEILQGLSEDFRYDRDLVTAEETEQWLADRGLTLDDFDGYCVRAYWREQLSSPAAASPLGGAAGTRERRQDFRVHLVISGAVLPLAREFSWRVAAWLGRDPGIELAPAIERERQQARRRLEVAGEMTDQWSQAPSTAGPWYDEWLAMEAAFQQQSLQVLTPERLQQRLNQDRLELIAVEMEWLSGLKSSVAREAFLCLREQSLTMRELAEQLGSDYQQETHPFGQWGPDLQLPMLRASPGDVLEPIATDEGFSL